MTDTDAPERVWLTAELPSHSWPGAYRTFRCSDLEHEACQIYVRADLANPDAADLRAQIERLTAINAEQATTIARMMRKGSA